MWRKWVWWLRHPGILGTFSLASQLDTEHTVLMSPPKETFDCAKPQKRAGLLTPHSPRYKCSFSLPFVSFEKLFPLRPSCHYNCVSPLVPWPMKGEPCVMGERKIYKKRKPGVQCSLGRDYSQTVVSEPCVCGQGDFEWWVCDSGDLCRGCTFVPKYCPGRKPCRGTGCHAALWLGLYHIAEGWPPNLLSEWGFPFICRKYLFLSMRNPSLELKSKIIAGTDGNFMSVILE